MDLKTHFTHLLAYDQWANALFIQILRETGNADEEKRLMSHILHAHRTWVNRIFGKPEEVPDIWEIFQPDQLTAYAAEIHLNTQEILEKFDLETVIGYRNRQNKAFQNTIVEILQHVLNHSTHHRSQIAILLRKRGVAPPASDYIFYLREK